MLRILVVLFDVRVGGKFGTWGLVSNPGRAGKECHVYGQHLAEGSRRI